MVKNAVPEGGIRGSAARVSFSTAVFCYYWGMTTAERLHEILNSLPPTSQREVLDFAESLAEKRNNGDGDQRLELMQQAMSDPLFLADLDEITEDFRHADDEVVA